MHTHLSLTYELTTADFFFIHRWLHSRVDLIWSANLSGRLRPRNVLAYYCTYLYLHVGVQMFLERDEVRWTSNSQAEVRKKNANEKGKFYSVCVCVFVQRGSLRLRLELKSFLYVLYTYCMYVGLSSPSAVGTSVEWIICRTFFVCIALDIFSLSLQASNSSARSWPAKRLKFSAIMLWYVQLGHG